MSRRHGVQCHDLSCERRCRVITGLIARQFLADRARTIEAVLPILSIVFIVLIVACIVALSKDQLLEMLSFQSNPVGD